MRVTIRLPFRTRLFEDVAKVDIPTQAGRYTVLPRHRDFGVALVSGIAELVHENGEEAVAGLDGGVVVKSGSELSVVTPRAVVGKELGEVSKQLQEQLEKDDDRRRQAEQALARMEIELARRLVGDGGDGNERGGS